MSNQIKKNSSLNKYLPTNFSTSVPYTKIALYGFFILSLFLTISISYLYFDKDDFYLKVKIITLIICITLLIITFGLNVIVVYKNFNINTIVKTMSELPTTLKIEIKGLNFSYKSLLLSGVILIIFLLLITFYNLKMAFIFLFFGTIYIIKNVVPSIKSFNNQVILADLKIKKQYKSSYTFIYYFNKFIKIVFFTYIMFFFFWCVVAKSYLWIDKIANCEEDPQLMRELSESGQTLYLLYCFFLNSVLLDYLIESFIMYATYSEPILITRHLINLGVRTWRVASFAAGGSLVAGVAVAYTPLVEIPGVNEFQIRFGRGFGYSTGLDYAYGMIYTRHFSKEDMAALIEKHNGEDKILDAIFFKLLSEDKDAVQMLKKTATINELRFLGIRKW